MFSHTGELHEDRVTFSNQLMQETMKFHEVQRRKKEEETRQPDIYQLFLSKGKLNSNINTNDDRWNVMVLTPYEAEYKTVLFHGEKVKSINCYFELLQ